MPAKKKTSRKSGTVVTRAAASLAAPVDYAQLLSALKSRIQIARVHVARPPKTGAIAKLVLAAKAERTR